MKPILQIIFVILVISSFVWMVHQEWPFIGWNVRFSQAERWAACWKSTFAFVLSALGLVLVNNMKK